MNITQTRNILTNYPMKTDSIIKLITIIGGLSVAVIGGIKEITEIVENKK
jgi:Trk-type K+ transport system membrane component